jgi:hypothetical protein
MPMEITNGKGFTNLILLIFKPVMLCKNGYFFCYLY